MRGNPFLLPEEKIEVCDLTICSLSQSLRTNVLLPASRVNLRTRWRSPFPSHRFKSLGIQRVTA